MTATHDTHDPDEALHEQVQKVYKKYVKEGDHPEWTGAFNEEERLAQFEEDLEAGNTVPILLTFIAGIGLVMAAVLLTYVTWMM